MELFEYVSDSYGTWQVFASLPNYVVSILHVHCPRSPYLGGMLLDKYGNSKLPECNEEGSLYYRFKTQVWCTWKPADRYWVIWSCQNVNTARLNRINAAIKCKEYSVMRWEQAETLREVMLKAKEDIINFDCCSRGHCSYQELRVLNVEGYDVHGIFSTKRGFP